MEKHLSDLKAWTMMNKNKHAKPMVWIKLFWMALFSLALVAMLIYFLYGWLDHGRSGHRTTKLTVEVAKNMENGISTPAFSFPVEQLVQSAVHTANSGLQELIRSESTKYMAAYAFKTAQDGFYSITGALQDSIRLDDLLNEQTIELEQIRKSPNAVARRSKLLAEQSATKAQRRYFNANNRSSIGLIRASRYITIGSQEKVAMSLELTTVSNEAGNLMKFKLWRLAMDYSECVVPCWKKGVSLSIRVMLSAVVQDGGAISDRLLLDDIIELPYVELGAHLEHDALSHLETKWFAMPPRLKYTLGTMDGSDAIAEYRDRGNFTMHIQVTEAAIP